MIWFFTFTSTGIAVFALLMALKKMVRIPFMKIVGSSFLLALAGLISLKARN